MALGPLSQAIRSRSHEERIAALPAACSHCGLATTRGEVAAHEQDCPQRPRACSAAEAGCAWSGLLADKAAHEATCPFAVCQRMMAPLQTEVVELRAENSRLQAQLAPLQAQLAAQGVENSQLRSRVVALEAGEGGEEGGRRVRQRVGAAPHDAPPSDAAVQAMAVAAAAATLRVHVSVSRVAVAACRRLANLCIEVQNRQLAAEAGAIEAIVAAMQAHPQVAGVQAHGQRLRDLLA